MGPVSKIAIVLAGVLSSSCSSRRAQLGDRRLQILRMLSESKQRPPGPMPAQVVTLRSCSPPPPRCTTSFFNAIPHGIRRDGAQIVEVIQRKQDCFGQPVLGPLAVDLEVDTASEPAPGRHASYLENALGFRSGTQPF